MSTDPTTPSATTGAAARSQPLRRPAPWAVAALVVYWVALGIATHIPLRMAKRVEHGDKIVHALAYAGLASLLFLVVAVLRRMTWGTLGLVFGAIAAYATVDEVLQDLVPHRTSDFKDWCADLLGAGCALVVCGLMYGWHSKRSPS